MDGQRVSQNSSPTTHARDRNGSKERRDEGLSGLRCGVVADESRAGMVVDVCQCWRPHPASTLELEEAVFNHDFKLRVSRNGHSTLQTDEAHQEWHAKAACCNGEQASGMLRESGMRETRRARPLVFDHVKEIGGPEFFGWAGPVCMEYDAMDGERGMVMTRYKSPQNRRQWMISKASIIPPQVHVGRIDPPEGTRIAEIHGLPGRKFPGVLPQIWNS